MEIIFFMMKIYLEIQLAMWSQKNVSIAIPLLGNDVWNKRDREIEGRALIKLRKLIATSNYIDNEMTVRQNFNVDRKCFGEFTSTKRCINL